ncbi:MAG: hypothetical protein R2932_03725 [Caldilineaceae bacterium]
MAPTQGAKALQQLLAESPSRKLFALLAGLGLPIASSRPKTELIAQLHEHLTQPLIVTSIVAQLNAESKDALRHLLAADSATHSHL